MNTQLTHLCPYYEVSTTKLLSLFRFTRMFTRSNIGPIDTCTIQDNCIDNVCFFGGGHLTQSDDVQESSLVRHLQLNNTSIHGNTR